MIRQTLFILVLLTLKLSVKAQSDSVMCSETFKITEGIYINYEDFRKNSPVKREEIDNKLNKELLDYFGKTLEAEKFSIIKGASNTTLESKKVWGYYQNNALHVNYNGVFYRVPVFGSISYLIAMIDVISPGFYPSYGGGIGGAMTTTIKTKELREFILNFYDGILIPFNMEDAEKLISRDATVYAEYKLLKRKKQKEQISRFFRKYNELHPVYFLNNN